MNASQVLPFLVALGFTLWMLWDAVSRRAGLPWIAAISCGFLDLPGSELGAIAYFLIVRMPRTPWGRRLLGQPGTDAVQGNRMSTAQGALPGLAGTRLIDVADGLEARGRYDEALMVYRRAAERQPESARVLHGLARCSVELGRREEAVAHFESLMAVDPRFRGYAAALEYAEALHGAGRTGDAVDLIRGMVEETGRMNHRVALAHYLELKGQSSEARAVLGDALAAYEAAPEPQQVADRKWHRVILDKLDDLPSPANGAG